MKPMKLALLFCLTAFTAMGQTSSKVKAPASIAAPVEVKIPAGAVKTEDGSYKATDSKGKKWVYRNTPFGIAKSEDKSMDPAATPFGKAKLQAAPVEEAKAVKDANPTLAVEEGDSYRFERTSPFGVTKWTRKKSDLDTNEQKIVADQKSKK